MLNPLSKFIKSSKFTRYLTFLGRDTIFRVELFDTPLTKTGRVSTVHVFLLLVTFVASLAVAVFKAIDKITI